MQSSLGGAYTITRELGGGGMSRVFVAEDTALGRSVVIKVLHPELAAGVNVERFKREVLLSARLQHPHIVPVLTAGEVNGLPYYVMPFVRGESLRARIGRGPMPPAEVKGLLGDVAKALAAAHEEGVVHRDIKPDNILVSGGAATVADFGIAKALSSARAEQDSEALTSMGTSLGTPAYMAPEQVAGDPNVDHRADIYSLGCVGYELLTGASPFAGKSPQQMLAAQVLESPVPVEVRQPDVPPSLAAVVMRCLEKDPSKRPQTATELVAAIDICMTGPTIATPIAPVKRRVSLAWIAAAVVGIASLSFFGYRSLNRPPDATTGINLAVAPFEVLDPQLNLWREGIVDVLSRNLDGAGPIRAISPSVSIKKWDGRADRTSAMAFGKRIGAELVLYGQLQGAGKDIVDAKVWILDTKADATPVEIGARDSVSRMDRLSDSLSLRLLTAIGRTRTIGAAKLSSIGSGSLPAIRAFLRGTQYFRRTQWDSAAVALKEAVALDSTFGIAYAMLGQAYGWAQGASAEGSRENYVKAGEHIRPGLSMRDSLLLTAIKHYTAGNSGGATRAAEYRQAYAAGEAQTQRYPDDPEGWYFLADMKYHSDRSMTEDGFLALFDQAIRADSDFAPAYIHAIELANRRGAEVGRRYTEAYLARNPRDNQADGIRLAARLASGTMSAADVKAVLDTVNPSVAQKATAPLARLPDSAESVIQILRAGARRMPTASGPRAALAVFLSMRGHIDESWKLFMEHPSIVAGEFVALGLIPPDSAMKTVGKWINMRDDASFAALPAMAAARDTATIAKLIAGVEKAIRPEMPPQQRAGMGYFIQAAHAYAALAKGDTATATRAFDALPESTFTIPVDQFIRARLVAKTDPRRAQHLLERVTGVNDLLYTARALEHARVSEKLGDTQKAVDSYRYVAAMWQNTDSPMLRTAVQESHDALKRLDSDGRLRVELRKR